LHALLTNPLYIGKVQYKDQLYDGEHKGFIDPELFQRVQQTLANNRRHTKGIHPGKYGGILKGILRCKACDCGMSHSFSKKGNKRYRYYVCQNAVARGWSNCPHPSLPADEMERFVVDEIRKIGFDEKLIESVAAESMRSINEEIVDCEKPQQALHREITDGNNRLKTLASGSACEDTVKELASLQEKIRLAERDMKEGRLRLDHLKSSRINADEIRQACRRFDPLWDTLTNREQWRMLTLLLDRVEFDAGSGSIKT
jgi:site-specific DNA recombinase